MNNRAFGIVMLAVKKGVFNRDFEHNPNMCLDEYVSSPYAIKYAIRKYWHLNGFKLIMYKQLKEGIVDKAPAIMPKSLDEVLEDLIVDRFGKDKIKGSNKKAKFSDSHNLIQNLLFEHIDVACFGGTFATSMYANAYTGPIQFGYGVNKFEDIETIRTSLLSPFQNSSKAEATASTVGSDTYVSEGHYVYDFTVNPNVNDMYKELYSDFKGFTRENYEDFKEAAIRCVSADKSVSRKGCYNEFALFVELNEGSKKYLGQVNDKVLYRKNPANNKGIIDLSLLEEDLKEIFDDIKSIEIYHNPVDTEVLFTITDKVVIKNILSEKEVDFSKL